MKNQSQFLQGWIADVLEVIKKDIKTEHLSSDPTFYCAHFGTRPQNRLTSEEIFAAYEKELLKGNEELGIWVVNRWVFKHGDVYQHFAERLAAVNPDFEQIVSLTEEQSKEILRGAKEAFGATPVFLFSVLNGVVFPENIIGELRAAAEKERSIQKVEKQNTEEKQTLEQILARHSREVARLEAKIVGVQKKYATDVDGLKKQIRSLQQKLSVK